MFKKLRDFYRRNRVYSILMIISVVCIISIMVGIILYFINQTNQDKYGNRLEGIESIPINSEKINEIEESIKSNEKVSSVEIDIKGKLVYVMISLTTGSHSDAESIAQASLEVFGDDIKNFYDLQFIVSNNDKEVEDNFPIMGYLKNENAVIRWTNYVIGE
ncbi:MAG: hypothetical protein IJD92_04850 [Bacilli bacterium]|nr:hypothetical protein [Bacilli bacterium]